MIDIESDVFGRVAKKVRESYPKIFIVGEYVKSPPSFPSVMVVEDENREDPRRIDSGDVEKFAELLYTAEVYSNKIKGKKTEARAILSIIDSEFRKMGFTRIMLSPVPNQNDPTIYRVVARYKAIVSSDMKIYGR